MKQQREKPSFRDVYAVEDSDRNACKIGVSTNVKKRVKDLQTGSSRDLRLVHREPVEYAQATKVEFGARRLLVSQGHSKKREWIK